MANRGSTAFEPEAAAPAAPQGRAWAWHPPLPLAGVPVFVWPPRPLAALRYLLSLAFLGSVLVPFGTLATLSWLYLQPALERCAELRADWMLQMYARNLGLMLLVAGGLHLYFYTFGRQGAERKLDPRGMGTNDRQFFARNQVWDDMLWTCASGVTIWTAYEAGFMWAWANDLLPFYLRVDEHPVWFAATLVTIPFWASLHFYFVHRLLHRRPLYRIAHALHHRYYDCNYGNPPMPWDRWLGTDHDGTPRAMAEVVRRRRERLRAAAGCARS